MISAVDCFLRKFVSNVDLILTDKKFASLFFGGSAAMVFVYRCVASVLSQIIAFSGIIVIFCSIAWELVQARNRKLREEASEQ